MWLAPLILTCCIVILAGILSVYIYATYHAQKLERIIAVAWGPMGEDHHLEPVEGLGGFSAGMSSNNARVLSDLISRVVHKREPGSNIELRTYLGSDSVAAIYTYNGVLAVCARGTATRDELMSDMKTEQIDYKGCGIHRGMIEVYIDSHMRAEVLKLVEETHPSAILLAGHSLGAGLVSILLLDLPNHIPVNVYTFGAPRIGDERFVKTIDKMQHVTYHRICNKADIITDLPLTLMPRTDKPEGKLEAYLHAGKSREFFYHGGTWRENHRMAVYVSEYVAIGGY